VRSADEILTLRPALPADIPAMHALRLAVRENVLRDASKVPVADYERRLAEPDAGWLAEQGGAVVGFTVADLPSRSIWALFVMPGFEGRGIGRGLLQQVTRRLAAAGPGEIHLSTEAGTRAERFYAAAGWKRAGYLPTGEIHFVCEV